MKFPTTLAPTDLCSHVLDFRHKFCFDYATGWRMASMSTLANSGRENSRGGISPACNIWRTFVPLRVTCSSLPWGQVFAEAIESQVRQKKVWSKNMGVIPSLAASNSEKMCCASYVP